MLILLEVLFLELLRDLPLVLVSKPTPIALSKFSGSPWLGSPHLLKDNGEQPLSSES